ncbi:DNA-binding MarR family transcriptional regulator [Clostridium saccharoperbutylacetonicum]|uniref:Transcriptional regulator, MarR family n=1 Tax=Clostridium saccharoperbutylacetonicum N1-4(HMT) TaxID=931276 RepID=M1MJY9_9CLOT|nr:MarR family transcriptional regulator [Clostridium saccharoperbutylacetonicum]AGF56623.1 transcriptional regulator, MarR family [Clostridium saccharoperbutylacetonicum N1-4(HMT)]NRT62626.1 DNA-binding MarR family transcriptional regulator [Clostridium saccharoperbutylacetonicum]NSB25973.1 DNA-binding MarR family transcriptional regulator [Clostridium saccharoperbutylacetonicum]NSB45331.1 DNA-binding MarR family transcriptional regulator [Clostridium saccharoperbutylacetonicum]
MNKDKSQNLILNMVNFYTLFSVEFIDLIPDLTNSEITPLLSRILNFIHFEGTTTATKISKKLNITIPNTSRSINTLNKLGYIVKKQDENDKRVIYLSLSAKAINLILSVAGAGESKFLDKFKVLSENEILELSHSFLRLQELLIKIRDLNLQDNKKKS